MAAELGETDREFLGVSTNGTGGIPPENRGYHGCLLEPSRSSLRMGHGCIQMPVIPAINEDIAEEVTILLN